MRDRVAFLFMVIAAHLPSAGRAADLVQPWPKGLSSMEFYLSAANGQRRELSLLLGFGLTQTLSLGVFAATGGEGGTLGALGLATFPLAPTADVDVWVEVGGDFLLREAEQMEACITAGAEVTLYRAGLTPYARLTVSWQGEERTVHPLLGIMAPAGERWRVHLEVSGEKVSGSPWPLHVTVGPNFVLNESTVLLSEVAYIRPDSSSKGYWSAMLGLVLDPRSLLRRPHSSRP